jgi:aspartate aminotransferase-like enzyme
MKIYPIPMVPGPVSVSKKVFEAYQMNYGSADIEYEFLELYNKTEENLQKLMGTSQTVVMLSGEGMIALWGALKNCLIPGDRVLALSTGVFGEGFGVMAKSLGAEVTTLQFEFNETLKDWEAIETMIQLNKPKMITVIHCETPSGTLNPIAKLGELKKQYGVELLVVDAVASLGGTPVLMDEWGVDLLLGGSQKVLSMPPSMSMVGISENAWKVIEEIDYKGYDAFLPFKNVQKTQYFPYTPNWHGVAALYAASQSLIDEGLEQVFLRHEQVAEICRQGVLDIGLELFVKKDSIMSPTVTAVKVPEEINWKSLDKKLRENGLACGGSYGPLDGKVFRFGHMGTQANQELMQKALEALRKSI